MLFLKLSRLGLTIIVLYAPSAEQVILPISARHFYSCIVLALTFTFFLPLRLAQEESKYFHVMSFYTDPIVT